MNPEAFSDLAAARHSVRDFRPDPVPGEVLDAILDDARQAPSWSNTRPFMVALATGERADRLRAAYVAEFDATLPVQHKERGAMARLVLSGRAPDGDYRTWALYPAELLPHSQAVSQLSYSPLLLWRENWHPDTIPKPGCQVFLFLFPDPVLMLPIGNVLGRVTRLLPGSIGSSGSEKA